MGRGKGKGDEWKGEGKGSGWGDFKGKGQGVFQVSSDGRCSGVTVSIGFTNHIDGNELLQRRSSERLQMFTRSFTYEISLADVSPVLQAIRILRKNFLRRQLFWNYAQGQRGQ